MGALQKALAGYTPPSSAAAQSQPQAADDSSSATATPSQILMIAPSGSEAAYVPPDQVDSYLAKGAKVGIRMTAPDGKQKAIVPFDRQDDFQKQGATWDVHPDNDAAKAFLTQRSVSQSRSQAPGKARVIGPDGMPMLMDVPQGQESSTEAANQRGQAIGTAVGAGTVATVGLGAALAAPGIITEEAATGLLDEFGEPITREIIKQGPSLLGKGFQAASEWAAANPMTAKTLIGTVGLGAAVKVWHVLSKIEQEFGGK
jgi:hypothetical protein